MDIFALKRNLPNCLKYGPVGNERGVALILALSMLTILSLLGALALTTSTTERGISSNYKSSQEAFFAAQRAVEYAMGNSTIYTTIGKGTANLTGSHVTNIAAGTTHSGLDTNATNSVSYLSSGPPPEGSGTDPTYFESRYYVIQATGQGPNSASAKLESSVARTVPK